MILPTAYFQLFLDPELNHSAGYFNGPDTSLAQAQRAKNDAILARCELRPSMTLLDIGSGWGAAVRLAAAEHGVRAIGITVDEAQHAYAVQRQRREPSGTAVEFRLQPWAEFTTPVDRIICVNAFENFVDKADFLAHCRTLLPPDGRLVMLTVTADRPMFRVISKDAIIRSGEAAGFEVRASGSLAAHYVRTLECFMDHLRRNRQAALDMVAAEEVEKTLRFYATSADLLRRGMNDMFEFTFVAPAAQPPRSA